MYCQEVIRFPANQNNNVKQKHDDDDDDDDDGGARSGSAPLSASWKNLGYETQKLHVKPVKRHRCCEDLHMMISEMTTTTWNPSTFGQKSKKNTSTFGQTHFLRAPWVCSYYITFTNDGAFLSLFSVVS